jgi:hypothetical protein
MVVGAFVVRGGALGGGDDEGDGGDVAVVRLACTTELAGACASLAEVDDRLQVSVAAAGTLADQLGAGNAAPVDAWLAPAPWVGVVRELGAAGAVGEPSEVLARSPLVVAVAGDVPDCPGTATWRCLGDAAATLRPGIAALDETAGLFTVGQAGTAWFGREGYATNDLDAVPDGGGPSFGSWASSLLAAVPRGPFRTPVEDVLRTGSATYDLAASVEAVAAPAVARSRREPVPVLLYPAPMATVDVVVVPVATGDAAAAEAARGLLTGADGRAALAESGWRVAGEPLAAGIDPAVELDDGDGLPAAGVLAALRERL